MTTTPNYLNQRVEFHGTIDEAREKALLPFGSFSRIQNMRPQRPGLQQRGGTTLHHTSAGGDTQETISLYQFSKGEKTERHFFRQLLDGSVEESTDAPPTVTTGAFGSEVLAARSSASPASWSSIRDFMTYSDGAGQHIIYSGQTAKPRSFIIYKGSDMPDIPEGWRWLLFIVLGVTGLADGIKTYMNKK